MFMPATKHFAVAAVIAALSFTGIGFVSADAARATPALHADQANPTITITNEGVNYTFSPAQLDAKVGQTITITNKDQNGVHSVTAKDHSFSVDVPPASSVTLTVKKAGNYPYYCQYHVDAHNPASLNIT
jgi:plastocyanin